MLILGVAVVACTSPRGVAPVPRTGPQPPVEAMAWRHRSNADVAGSAANHSATDAVVRPGEDALVAGKFTYGVISSDLEDEEVTLWLRSPEGAWQRIGAATTNGDGRASLRVPGALLGEPGRYECQFVVGGDATRAYSDIWVVAPGTPAVVFDIDGTLTPGDSHLVRLAASGRPVSVRPGAPHVVGRWAEAGYLPVFLTGRPYLFNAATRDWLRRHGFAPGPLITPAGLAAALPGHSRVGRFKLDWLRWVQDHVGLDIRAAYGNADSDACAFSHAGLAAATTFIIGATAPIVCDGLAALQPVPDLVVHGSALEIPAPAPRPATPGL